MELRSLRNTSPAEAAAADSRCGGLELDGAHVRIASILWHSGERLPEPEVRSESRPICWKPVPALPVDAMPCLTVAHNVSCGQSYRIHCPEGDETDRFLFHTIGSARRYIDNEAK